MQVAAYISGFATLFVLWILYRLMAGTWDVWKLVEGADGHPSTSKLQWFIWTVVVLFSYVVIYSARIYDGDITPISDIPQNLLIAMGFSIASMIAAKGITSSYVASGQLSKPQVNPADTNLGSVVKDDTGVPDLSKIQVLAWTLIAVVSYLIRIIQEVHAGSPLNLPDIDPALMVLMGLGHGAYLGKKLVTTSTPRLTGLAPGQGTPGISVTLTGANFGAAQDGNLLTIDGQPIYPAGLTWSDTQLSFQIPAEQHNGLPWNPGQRIQFGLTVAGQQSANTLPFTVVVNAQNAAPVGNFGANPGQQPAVPAPAPTTFSTQVNPQITDATQGGTAPLNTTPNTATPQSTVSITPTDTPPQQGSVPPPANNQSTDS